MWEEEANIPILAADAKARPCSLWICVVFEFEILHYISGTFPRHKHGPTCISCLFKYITTAGLVMNAHRGNMQYAWLLRDGF